MGHQQISCLYDAFCVGVVGEDVMEVFWGNLVHNFVGSNCSAEFSPVREGDGRNALYTNLIKGLDKEWQTRSISH